MRRGLEGLMSDNLEYQFRSGLKRIELENEPPDVMPSAEKIILQIGGRTGTSFDIGALCYLKRKSYREEGGAWSKTGKRVVSDSLDEDRVKLINHFILYLFDLKDGFRTKNSRCMSLSRFIEFCEEKHNGVNQLKTEKTQENAAIFLRRIQDFYCKSKKIHHVWDFFCFLYEIEGTESQLSHQHWYGHERDGSSVKPLFDDEVKKVISFYQALFELGEGILVKKEKFPYEWKVPRFLEEKDNKYIVLPNTNAIFHKRQAEARKDQSAFDFILGDWYSIQTIKEQCAVVTERMLKEFPSRVKKNKHLIDEVNVNSKHQSRLYFGELAMMAYRNIFMLLLASNGSGLDGYEDYSDIPWGNFSKESYAKSYWKFNYLKGRAHYKKVEFKLLKTDYPLFERYLKLRKALINAYGKNEEDCSLLFFAYAKGVFKNFSNTKNFFKSFPEVPRITSQIARATKSDLLLHSTNDVRLVSQILQNTPKTVLRSYTRGTIRGHVNEVGGFLENLSVVVKKTVRQASEIESEVGECEKFEPKAIYSIPEKIKPDCGSKEGCLFCEQYRVHADERDVRKLLSYLYFIQEAELMLSKTKQFETYFKPVVTRVESILTFIKELSIEHEEMVIKLEEEVFEDGDLSEFFERELVLQEEVRKIWLT